MNSAKENAANAEAFRRLVESRPILTGMARAGEVIPGMKPNTVLHSGPEIEFAAMRGAHRQGIVGALLFEGIARDEKEAVGMIEAGEIDIRAANDFNSGAPGSGITSTSPYEVATTVNSCLRNGEIQQGDGWFRHDGIGYRGENLKLTAGPRTGDWRYVEGGLTRPVPEMKELFTLTVEHGVKPRNASYIYTILPGATPEETAGTPPGRVLRNTPECQAVEFADGVRAAIFYEPGRLDDFETDTPGAFLIGKGTVHAADPTGRHSSFTLKLNGVSRKVPLPAGEFAGQSVKIVLKQYRNMKYTPGPSTPEPAGPTSRPMRPGAGKPLSHRRASSGDGRWRPRSEVFPPGRGPSDPTTLRQRTARPADPSSNAGIPGLRCRKSGR